MTKKKSTAFYRGLLKDAWRITWSRKELWIFGFLAAFLSTGGVIDIMARSARRVYTDLNFYQQLLDGTFAGYRFFQQYMEQLQYVGPLRMTLTIALFIILALLIVVASIYSQGALCAGILSRKRLKASNAIKKGAAAAFHIFGINLLAKFSVLVLVLLTTSTLLLAATSMNVWTVLLYLGVFFLFVPSIIIINIIAILAVIDSVHSGHHALDAIHQALIIFRRHWLVSFELGVILFLIIFFSGLAGMIVLVLLAIPLTLLSVLSVLSAIPFLFFVVNVFIVILYVFLIATFIAITVVYQYACWTLLYQKVSKRGSINQIRPKLHRLWWD